MRHQEPKEWRTRHSFSRRRGTHCSSLPRRAQRPQLAIGALRTTEPFVAAPHERSIVSLRNRWQTPATGTAHEPATRSNPLHLRLLTTSIADLSHGRLKLIHSPSWSPCQRARSRKPSTRSLSMRLLRSIRCTSEHQTTKAKPAVAALGRAHMPHAITNAVRRSPVKGGAITVYPDASHIGCTTAHRKSKRPEG